MDSERESVGSRSAVSIGGTKAGRTDHCGARTASVKQTPPRQPRCGAIEMTQEERPRCRPKLRMWIPVLGLLSASFPTPSLVITVEVQALSTSNKYCGVCNLFEAHYDSPA